MSKKLIHTLLHLAQVDGNVSGSELALIYKIAVAKGVPMFEVEQMIQNPPQQAEDLGELSDDDRFEYIYTIILMIKMDGKLDEREFDMCNKYAVALGYDYSVISELMNLIKSDFDLSENKLALKQKIQKFLK
jgi:uncharacterized tellurite resistance protein B-like protein